MAFTYFFRDIAALKAVEEHVIPELRKNKYITIWDAGCAMGPEPYSLAIIFKENLGYYEFKRFKIFATDLDEENNQFGKIIAAGIYPEESIKRIPKGIFSKYFSQDSEPGNFKIADEIINCITFKKHDLRLLQPMGENFGLIVCKNVLLHLQESERLDVIRMFHKALAPGGFLVTEQTQKMPVAVNHRFRRVARNVQLFQKK